MFRKILIPLDGSELAEHALGVAVDLATKLKGELILFHVAQELITPMSEMAYSVSSPHFITRLEHSYRDEAERYLEGVAARVMHDDLTVTVRIEEGDVADAIVKTAEREADIIVMTSHGYTGFTKWVLGSVTERVVAHATCPVLIVKNERPLSKLLVPLDGSSYAETAIEPALEIAAAMGGELTCLNVIEPPADVANALVARLGLLDPELDNWLKERNQTHARDYLESVARSCATHSTVPLNMVMRKDQPADGILAYAEHEDMDLIVISTHGRAGMAKWLMGSVTEKVVQQAPCHVLIIRPLL
jgi:nucleotide-binding universal stress UspA family protein